MTTKTRIQDAAPAAAAEPAADTGDQQPTHNIRTTVDVAFWRGDHKWHPDGEDVARADFTDEQWEAITAEPLLVVTSL